MTHALDTIQFWGFFTFPQIVWMLFCKLYLNQYLLDFLEYFMKLVLYLY